MKLTVSVCLLVIGFVLVFPAAAQEGGLLVTITPRNADRVVELAMLAQDAPAVFAWTPDGALAVTGQPGVWLYDTAHLETEPRLLAGDPATALAVSPAGLVAAANETIVSIWTLDDPEDEPRRLDIAADITGLAFSPTGLLAAVTADGTVFLADPASGETQRLPDSYPGIPSDLVFSPDGAWLAACGAEDLYVWEAASGKLHRQDQGAGCAFSPDGALLVTVGAAGIELRDPASGAVVAEIDAGPDISALAFSPDGAMLAAGSADGTVGLWDTATGTQRRVLSGHTGTIRQLAFSPDGSHLASRDDDTIRLWGLVAFASSAPTDLVVGATAIVHVTDDDVLNVRGGAGVSFAVLAELPDSTPVTILGGPVYADGFTWWRVRTPDNIEGWAVDYADGVQTLVP